VLFSKSNNNSGKEAILRVNVSTKKKNETCGEGRYCVRLYSRRAALVNKFRLDAQENDLWDLESAKDFLHEAKSA
jgi:hypothetical protein